MRKKTAKLILISIFLLLISAGCGQGENSQKSGSMDARKIVILGKESYVYSDQALINGLDMAIEEINQQGIDLCWEHMDDNGEYETGILYGGMLAKDDSVLAVLTVQDFEVIDALAPVFDEAKKPFISIQGCNESTLQGGYQFFISAFTSAQDMGKAVADYCGANGIKRIACSHTDTTFELSEMRGFQRNAEENNIEVVDMIQGPNTMIELKNKFDQWEALQVDAVYLAHLTYSDTSWMIDIIRYIKEQNPDIQILSDYSLDNTSTLEAYGDVLEGVVIPAPYSIEENEKTQRFREKYKNKFGSNASNVAMQGYDLMYIFSDIIQKGYENGEGIMTRLKRDEGYEGTSGHIRFDGDGRLCGIEPQFLQVKDGEFVTVK